MPGSSASSVRADSSVPLREGRAAFARNAWADARDHLAAADAASPLAANDLELLATAAYLAGDDEESIDAWTRAHTNFLQTGQAPRAARCAFWIVLELINRGEQAPAMGWLQRAFHFLGDVECPEQGMLLVLRARVEARRGDRRAATESARAATELAGQFDDPELAVLSRLSLAQMHARAGHSSEAAMLLDELMVAVTVGNVSPIAVGVVYCAMIEACQAIHDVGRAREWTSALSRWCDSQPELVPFRGQCQVHRCEVLRLSGAWSQAITEAEHACAWMEKATQPRQPSAGALASTFTYPLGAAHYQRAEIHRMRGEFAQAEEAYRAASFHGHSAEPGLATLRLAQGRVDAAAITVRRLLAEEKKPVARASLLCAAVEVLLAVDDRPAARAAADELAKHATAQGSAYLRALSAQATGGILLAEGDPANALGQLRASWATWQELEAPYEAAKVRVMIALGCRALADEYAARLELEAARRVLERLEARHDLAIVDRLAHPLGSRKTGDLTARELDVIRLIATGTTNRAIGQRLGISERTVDRHVSNILRKLDLPSRAAATAYAVEHGLT